MMKSHSSKELKVLTEISQAVGSSLELKVVFERAMEVLDKELGMKRGMLAVLNANTGDLMIEVSHGLSREDLKTGRYTVSGGIPAKVLATGHPELISDIEVARESSPRALARWKRSGGQFAYLCVPIIIEGRAIGVIGVDKKVDRSTDLRSDLRLLGIVASVVAQAVRIAQMVRQLVAAKAYSANIIQNLSHAVLVLNQYGTITACNPAFETLFGLAPGSVIGYLYNDIFRDIKPILRLLTRAMEVGRSLENQEMTFVPSSGEAIPLSISSSKLRTEEGEVLGSIVTMQDLTEIKRLERQAQVSQRLAALGEVAAGIAHEVRNPLGAIRGASQLLSQMFSSEDSGHKFAEVIVREVDRLDEIVEGLIDFARPREGVVADISVPELLDRVISLVKNKAEDAGVEVEMIRPQQELLIRADLNKVLQSILNLCINGIEAMPRGGRLAVGCQKDNTDETHANWITIFIRDEGIGILPEHRESVFTPFFTTKEGGTGLGLSVCHRIIEEQGGRIDFTTEVGKGTTFYVRLPHLKDKSPA